MFELEALIKLYGLGLRSKKVKTSEYIQVEFGREKRSGDGLLVFLKWLDAAGFKRPFCTPCLIPEIIEAFKSFLETHFLAQDCKIIFEDLDKFVQFARENNYIPDWDEDGREEPTTLAGLRPKGNGNDRKD